jgi:hypothetical protein
VGAGWGGSRELGQGNVTEGSIELAAFIFAQQRCFRIVARYFRYIQEAVAAGRTAF